MNASKTSAPRTLRLAAGDYAATVVTTGAALCSLTWRGRDLILPFDPARGPMMGQGEVLLPWPNRIDRGRYAFRGTEYQLEITEPERGTAIHGLTRAEPWSVATARADRADLTYRLKGAPGYPGELELTVSYTLAAGEGLAAAITAVNAGSAPAPYGNGTHNYLTVGSTLDDAALRMPVAARLPVDARLIPSGSPLPVGGTDYDFRAGRLIGDTVLDTAFTEAERDESGRMWITLARGGTGAAMWADETYGWLQVFSADRPGVGIHRRGLAMEPMTCPPNAFATGEDLIVLEPGESATSTYGIQYLAGTGEETLM